MDSRAARPDAMRRHNLSLLLSEVHQRGELTRAELTQRLGMSRSTIGALVAELTDLGLVSESVPTGGARVGRPSHVVGPDPSGPFVVAADIDVTHVTLAAVGIGGAVLHRRRLQTDPGSNSTHSMAQLVAREVARLCGELPRRAGAVAVGVSVPGTVDRRTGEIGVAPNLGWRDEPFGALIEELLPSCVPVSVGNDADLAVLAEQRRGSAQGCADVIYLMGRVGVGAGVVIDGIPVGGHRGQAGEIGHIVVDPGGAACHCGKRGCLETYIGDGALLDAAGRAGPVTSEAIDALFADARNGDTRSSDAVRSVASELGRAIASLVNTLNPQRVLLGGSFAAVLELARPEIEKALAYYALESAVQCVQLIEPTLGADSALLGAAEIAFAAMLADPLLAANTRP